MSVITTDGGYLWVWFHDPLDHDFGGHDDREGLGFAMAVDCLLVVQNEG